MDNKFFYYLQEKNILLSRSNNHISKDSKINLICPECNKKYKYEEFFHNNYHYIDQKGKRYCIEHFKELKEVPIS